MKLIDKLLAKIGLVRKSKHEQMVADHREFTRRLAVAAKGAGVKVLLNETLIRDVELDSDVFVVGSRNTIVDVDIIGSCITTGPDCQFNVFQSIRFFPRKGEQP